MKALSVRAPWWWAILHLGKDIENRDWYTGFRGTVYLHASKWYVHRDVVDDLWGIERTMQRPNPMDAKHPYEIIKPFGGCIVGKMDIVGCVTKSDSPWFCGKHGLVLENPVAFEKPIPFKGALGFFDVPDGIEAVI